MIFVFFFICFFCFFFFFSSRRRHTRSLCDWSSDVCSSDLPENPLDPSGRGGGGGGHGGLRRLVSPRYGVIWLGHGRGAGRARRLDRRRTNRQSARSRRRPGTAGPTSSHLR